MRARGERERERARARAHGAKARKGIPKGGNEHSLGRLEARRASGARMREGVVCRGEAGRLHFCLRLRFALRRGINMIFKKEVLSSKLTRPLVLFNFFS